MFPTATTTDIAGCAPQVAVLPIGSFEQHGPFLPLATDSIVATAIAGAVAARYNVLLLPPVTISCSHEHAAWPGTVSISHHTLSAIIDDIRTSLTGTGITRLILVNGHGGNYVLSNFTDRG
jgi:creatinine amidohydrolase